MPHSVNSQILQAEHFGKHDVKMTATARVLKPLSIQITLLPVYNNRRALLTLGIDSRNQDLICSFIKMASE